MTLLTARDLAHALDVEMARQGKTRADISRALNVPPSTVTRWLNNTKGPTVYQAAQIARTLDRRIVFRLTKEET